MRFCGELRPVGQQERSSATLAPCEAHAPPVATGADAVTRPRDGGAAAIACLTFDIDTPSLDLFTRGAPPPAVRAQLTRVSYERVLPRILDLLDELSVPCTFFVIGGHAANFGDAVRDVARRGHEIGNHTQTHPKMFSRFGRDQMCAEIEECGSTLRDILGVRPAGFRAPGYTINTHVLAVLRELGYEYDASLVPSWSLIAAKVAYRAMRRGTHANYTVPQEWSSTLAPRAPYRPDPRNPFMADGTTALLEIPTSTTPLLQLPLINGVMARFGSSGMRRAWRSCADRPFLSVGFHDFEFVTDDDLAGLPAGHLVRPHLRIPFERRVRALRQFVESARATHRFVLMRDVAAFYP